MATVARDHEKASPPAEAETGNLEAGNLEAGNLALDLLALPGVRRLGDDLPAVEPAAPPAWTREELAGRLCELSAGPDTAGLTAAGLLVRDAQLTGSPVAWVTARAATFHPPDLATAGVDLAALVVVRAGDPRRAGRAADVLLRSGAFGLVVLELGTSAAVPAPPLPAPLQGRLVQLARKHDAAVLCLTEKPADAPSLGSLVSWRGRARRRSTGEGFMCEVVVGKDKRRGPGWRWGEACRGPEGLRH